MKLLLLITLGVVAALAEDTQVLKDFKAGYTQFTAAVYKELLKTNSGNFLVCPLSVDIILALVHNGAEGKTAQQLSAALHLPENKETIKQIFNELKPRLQGNAEYNLTSANKIYLKHGYVIKDQFKVVAVNVFDTAIENIDFLKKEQAAAEMNRWIEEKTDNEIKDLVSEDELNEATRAVLINALYFQGKWQKLFSTSSTRQQEFHINNNKKVEIDMMHKTDDFRYYESSELDAKMLELPYDGGEVTMTIVLPNKVEGLSALEDRIEEVIAEPKYQSEIVHVALPKFKGETTIKFKPIFQSLGVVDAFENFANFGGISAEPVKISQIVQKAIFEVDENGTKAAAATVVFWEFRRPRLFIDQPKHFMADHPFIYYLRNSAGIMFIGRYIQN